MPHPMIRNGFILAGLMNFSVLLFSKGFTNTILNAADPVVMSNFGLLMIMVWGLAYISIANTYQHTRWLIGVFALEKLIYFVVWITWLSNNSLSNVYTNDLFAGLFYSIYGINDFIFMCFFAWVWSRKTG
ncbi:MAG: hypothetical protein ACMZ64_10280 [Oleiphilus sp.]